MGNLTRFSLTIHLGSLCGFVAQTLWEEFLQAKWAREILTKKFGETKLNSSGNNPEGFINEEDLGYISQIVLPKMMGNDPMPCSFIYVIVPLKL